MKYLNVFKKNKTKKIKSEEVSIFKRAVKDLLLPNYIYLILAVLFMLIAAGSNTATAWLVKPVIDKIFVGKDPSSLYWIGAAFLLASLGKGIGFFGQAKYIGYLGARAIITMQERLYRHIMSQDLIFFNKNATGYIMGRMIEINQLRVIASDLIINLGRDLTTFLGLIVVMFTQKPVFSIVVLVTVPVIGVSISRLTKRLKNLSVTGLNVGADVNHKLEQMLNGIRIVKAYGMENAEMDSLKNTLKAGEKLSRKTASKGALVSPIMEVIGGSAIAVFIVYGGMQVINGTGEAGSFYAFLTAMILAYQPAKNLAKMNITMQMALVAAKRYYELIDTKPTITDKKDAKDIHKTKNEGLSINFKDVVFNYDEKTKVFNKLNLKIEKGKMVALVGRSGSGKTTLVNLIPRFYDVDSGKIEIEGLNVKDIKIASLRENMALITQEVVLFDNTIANNVKYSKPTATDDEVKFALKMAAADDFINKMPEGYNTQVGPKGVSLSGGQRQRIAIARAILKDAPILIMDEATSALDNESEKMIQKAMLTLVKNRTTIVIAHRLSTIKNADIIFLMEDGKIIESGNHEELIAKNGAYKNLYEIQFSKNE